MSLSRIAVAIVTSASLAVSACTAPAEAPGNTPAANTPAAESEVPSEPGRQLSALAPENITKARPAAPFDLTGNWFIDVTENPNAWRFGPPYPRLTAAAQVHFDASQVAAKEGKVYRDDIGQCWPAGLPLIMTRYWPMAMIQIPTAIYMVSGFMNSLRIGARTPIRTSSCARSTASRLADGKETRWSSTRLDSVAITTGWIREAHPFQPVNSCISSSVFA